MKHEIPDVQAVFRKGKRTRKQIANICWIMEKARELQKSIYLHLIDYTKAWLCRLQWTVQNSLRDGNMPASYETCLQVKKQQLDLDMEKKDCF